MDKVLSTKEIVALTANAVFATEGYWQGSALYGRLDNGRPASVISSEKKGLLSVRVNVPGNGNLGFGFQIFSDEATPARVNRYIRHHLSTHCQRVAEWETEDLLAV